MMTVLFRFLACGFLLLGMVQCQPADTGQVPHNNGSKAPTTQQPGSTPAQDALAAFKQEVSQCVKVEYMMYNVGITFETQSNQEVMRIINSLQGPKLNETNCPANNFDGSAVFKDTQGDIVKAFDFNLPVLSKCNRVVFKVDGNRFAYEFNQAGLHFFNQIFNQQQPPQGQ